MLSYLSDSVFGCAAAVAILLLCKWIIFLVNPKKLRFSFMNFLWYNPISISGTYSESAKRIKKYLNAISILIIVIILLEILFIFFTLMFAS